MLRPVRIGYLECGCLCLLDANGEACQVLKACKDYPQDEQDRPQFRRKGGRHGAASETKRRDNLNARRRRKRREQHTQKGE